MQFQGYAQGSLASLGKELGSDGNDGDAKGGESKASQEGGKGAKQGYATHLQA